MFFFFFLFFFLGGGGGGLAIISSKIPPSSWGTPEIAPYCLSNLCSFFLGSPRCKSPCCNRYPPLDHQPTLCPKLSDLLGGWQDNLA